LREEVDRYNSHQVHSTTRETPGRRFATALAETNSLFCPFSIPKPYTSGKDVFCLREHRMLNAYRRISLFGQDTQVPHVPLREEVDIHMVPDTEADHIELRIWWNDHMVHSLTLPLERFRVMAQGIGHAGIVGLTCSGVDVGYGQDCPERRRQSWLRNDIRRS
jgi:hypothetical protein